MRSSPSTNRVGDIGEAPEQHADGDAGRVHEQRLTPDMAARITHVFRRPV